jgi:hypothetical protein
VLAIGSANRLSSIWFAIRSTRTELAGKNPVAAGGWEFAKPRIKALTFKETGPKGNSKEPLRKRGWLFFVGNPKPLTAEDREEHREKSGDRAIGTSERPVFSKGTTGDRRMK